MKLIRIGLDMLPVDFLRQFQVFLLVLFSDFQFKTIFTEKYQIGLLAVPFASLVPVSFWHISFGAFISKVLKLFIFDNHLENYYP